MFLFLVQDEVQADGCILLNGDDRVLLHLTVWPQEHLSKYSILTTQGKQYFVIGEIFFYHFHQFSAASIIRISIFL